MKTVTLKSGDVTLEPYSEAHDERTVAWLNSDDLRATFGITRHIGLESHRAWVNSGSDTAIWAITTPATGHCGNVLLHCTPRHRSAYFQIYVGSADARGRGIGRHVMYAILDHAFGPMKLHRLWLHTLVGNLPAERLYRDVGFVDEGLERDSVLRDGRFDSQRRWSLLAGEWVKGARS